ncbi:hypothetical protein AGABI1DRAFT_92761 [Agaricus bisporus var. burnettii JB137-S8]|uniref:Uncharacterized protein n=1 Tax=Agaricus bisporus var. burnettii (strain JB137-S8 / ATCC MYA-4627 / FGSC 10392) TaxID=597362 RepID=K5X5K8_AGABU|nr:uncharacterized protein AGABI1DRAFT_92761 [Agaricus bisporus var. burnettii JB137-S8]EKM78473.1 hypothetical protein AGABI1DRAFT_92761 [Agaricus bisporus var. burnettii JB137-S8]
MPSLSFVRPKAPKWKSIVSNRTPFPSSRFDNLNTSSPHPYASPDILDINDKTSSLGPTRTPPSKSPSPRHPTPSPPSPPPAASSTSLAPPTRPVQIDIDLSSEPFDSDWFQTRFIDCPTSPREKGKGTVNNRIPGGRNSTVGFADIQRAAINKAPAAVDEEDDIDITTSEDDVLDDLKAMDASTILGISPPSNKMVEPPSSSPMKRNPLAPIKVPNYHMHGSQVQLIRSGEAKSRPLSEVSSIESSAVSGQTIARALLGNSFILSSDSRSSRYRSGFGGLARADSATLPRGDHPSMNPPYWKDQPMSGLSDNFAVGSDAPPIPANADKVYVPPRAPRASSLELKKNHNLRRHSSTSSLVSSKDGSGDSKSRPSSFSDFSREVERVDTQALRRISRISEAPSTPSTNAINTESTPPLPSSEQLPVESSAPQAEISTTLPPESSSHSQPFPRNDNPPAVSTTSNNDPNELDVEEYYASEMQRTFAPLPIVVARQSTLISAKNFNYSGDFSTVGNSQWQVWHLGRMDLSSVRRPSDGAVIARNSSSHRRSIQASSDPNSPLPPTSLDNNVSGGVSGRRVSQSPPAGRVVGGRLRAGSSPGPIKITRDSKDYNIYKIVTPFPGDSSEMALTEDSGLEAQQMQQTFPETPNVFSPNWSSGIYSPGMVQGVIEGQQASHFSQTPMHASFTSHTSGPHAGSDQEMLGKATSMVQAGHSRQSSIVRRMLPQPGVPVTTNDRDVAAEEGVVQIVQAPSSRPTETSPVSSVSMYSVSNEESRPSHDEPHTGLAVIEAAIASPWSRTSSPTLGHPIPDNTSHSPPLTATLARSHSPLSNNAGSAHEFSASVNTQTNSLHPNPWTSTIPSSHNHYVQASPPVVITPPAGERTLIPSFPYLGRSLRRISETSQNFDSPPPYDTIDHNRPPSVTPSLSNSNDEQQYIGDSSSQLTPPAAFDSSNESPSLGRKASIRDRDRRVRQRPGGPRRPVSNLPGPGKSRNASSSPGAGSSSNAATTSTRNFSATPLLEPKALPNDSLDPGPSSSGTTSNNTIPRSPVTPNFDVPPMLYRGLTIDQAKWTFTSSQLQAVVSRAIKQSAEASNIRLLRLDTLDNEIPQDLQRLEMQKTEIKNKYQSLTRTSKLLFSKLDHQIASDSVSSQRTVEELKDTVQQLNVLTEQLHVLDQQHAQIEKLVEVHSASALSMALRKLNASFLEQLAQTQELQRQVGDMEEEIMSLKELRTGKPTANNLPQVLPLQASSSQQTAYQNHINDLHSSPESEKKRVTASTMSRKSSVRYSRSNRMSGRLSFRSSWSSFGTRGSMFGGAPGTSSGFSIPPVPPLPRRRPTAISTEFPTRRTTMVSIDDGTPGTEVRAMIHAQEELYQSLGMSLGGDNRVKRSHSIIGLPGSPEYQSYPSATGAHILSPRVPVTRMSRLERELSPSSDRVSSRPLSYPASLLDAYNHLDADRNAMLATLEMMSQDDC